MELRHLTLDDLRPDLLRDFLHHETVTQQYRKINGEWVLADAPYVREWSAEKRTWLITYLAQGIEGGGAVIGAFDGARLVGFARVDGQLRGEKSRYANLSMLFVSDDRQRQGVGARLIEEAYRFARGLGAERLYVSATPKPDSVAFYLKRGFRDAVEDIGEFNDSPEDRHMERILTQ